MTTASKKKTKKKKKVASRTGKSKPAKKAKPPKTKEPFTAKAKLFADYYIADPNGAKAVVSAGYSKKGARQQAHVLLTNPDIREYIDQGMKAKHEEITLTGVHLIQAIEDLVIISKDPDHKAFNGNTALKGIFYLGRQQQMEFATEKHEVVTHGDIAKNIAKGRERVRRAGAGARGKTTS